MSRIGSLFSKFRPSSKTPSSDAGDADDLRWLVVGLGNPGGDYARSRHNLGFMVVKRIADKIGAEFSRKRFNAIFAQGRLDGASVLLMQAQTYYNETGTSVAQSLKYFRIPIERLLIVHDELDLEWGEMRLKRSGGDAGNRGIRSIIAALGTSDFLRLRIGIKRPAEVSDTIDYLLDAMSPDELTAARQIVDRATEAAAAVLVEGPARAMNRINQRTPPSE